MKADLSTSRKMGHTFSFSFSFLSNQARVELGVNVIKKFQQIVVIQQLNKSL